MPLSGMVPPLVSASSRVPGREARRPLTRSHDTRARSPAWTSLGKRPATMPRTAWKARGVSASYAYAPRTRSYNSRSSNSSTETMATICWARTSNGLRGTALGSTSPRSIPPATTAASITSSRWVGRMRPLLCLPDQVAGAAHPLQSLAHPLGRLQLDDQIDRADVDAEFERRRAHQRGQPAALQVALHREPRLAGHAAVVGADGFEVGYRAAPGGEDAAALDDSALDQPRRPAARLAGPLLVQAVGGAFGQPTAVGEDQRRVVAAHVPEHPRDDHRPDRSRPAGRGSRRPRSRPAGPGASRSGRRPP